MDVTRLAEAIVCRLPYEPNEQQVQVVAALARFCCHDMVCGPDRVFVLNGFAGTGKTSLTGALVKALTAQRVSTVLLAPTGRAAKVFGAYAGRAASTIHRAIYRHMLGGASFGGGAPLRENNYRDTVFIVDEASMIAADEGRENILRDLIQYIYGSHNCRLILLGDTAQLPPVGSDESPAMNSDELRGFGLKVSRATLTQVARQGAGSGILENATRLRRAQAMTLAGKQPAIPMKLTGYDDIAIAYSDELPDMLSDAYSEDGTEETVVITRSNRSATEFNQAIRTVVLGREELLNPGDLMIAAKNNYFWTRRIKGLDFIANGEILRVRSVNGTETRYGLQFADLTFELPDNPEVAFDAKIITGCLTGYDAALDSDSTARLYHGLMADSEVVPPGATQDECMKALRVSPYWNALQMKFAYAVTCHKAQGGQWKNVFVDLGYVPVESSGLDYLRWLYTAVTRARSRLYFINAPTDD